MKGEIRSLIWLGVAVVYLCRKRHQGRSRISEAFLCGAAVIVCRMVAGIIVGTLGRSPYDHSLEGIILNLWRTVPVILGRECLRAAVIGQGRRKTRLWRATGIAILYTAMDINIQGFTSLKTIEEITIYTIKYPTVYMIENILLNLLVIYGNERTSFTYALMTGLFEWLFPVLPVLNWLTEAVIGIALMLVMCLMVSGAIWRKENHLRTRRYRKENMVGTGILLTLCVLMIWFVEGVFGVFPSVVLTGSMEPGIRPGDMVIVRNITSEEEIDRLAVGDVITFQRDDIIITHRIVEVVKDEYENISYRTKGDNNSAEDVRLVKPEEIKGKNMCTIPYVGLPVLWIKGRLSKVPEGVVN